MIKNHLLSFDSSNGTGGIIVPLLILTLLALSFYFYFFYYSSYYWPLLFVLHRKHLPKKLPEFYEFFIYSEVDVDPVPPKQPFTFPLFPF
jgi:hypothetical protein